MQYMGLNELREKFLSFMESKGHLRLPSFPLIPKDDNSLLLINSGMAPMKKYFTGEVTPPRNRVTTCQKCIRTPDIERVGITARHGTYFEMLGNFSFGDYFKHEATAWAWEFFTKVLEMPEELLYCSVYEEDDETVDIWTKEVGVDPSHIVRLGKEDNFWEHGSGPCGPCSEIYFDRGPEKGCGKPDCHVGCECDRFVEVWNLVFSQFESDGKGNYTELKKKNIDTGMGLERLACVMQGVDNLFLVDTVQNIMKHISQVVGVTYGEDEKKDISLRVITDHIRSTTFMIADGVMPSNEGRGYVLRRLLRRAARHGRLLGCNKPFLYQICETVVKENASAYPELVEKKDYIVKLIKVEEENFAKTIDQGLSLLESIIERDDVKMLSGEDAFKLNDTFGFPIDLTREILAEKGIDVDVERFHELMLLQKQRSRKARKNAGADAWISDSIDFTGVSDTEFIGYTDYECDSKILAIVKNGERVDRAQEGDSVVIVLDRTPFYAESGGQVADTGELNAGDCAIDVDDVKKDASGKIFMHMCEVSTGTIAVGDTVTAKIDVERRLDIMRNHTAAHLLQAALREVLGTHVQQAGQLVNEDVVRFDFTHFSAMTVDEMLAVEKLVNDKILEGIAVTCTEMSIDEAKKKGAMALFGEKYGDIVRVVEAGEFSKEFCGGTHVDNTAKIGLFKIKQEGSVAAGVRRIEAVTGHNIINYLANVIKRVGQAAEALHINNPLELVDGAVRMMMKYKEMEKEIERYQAEIAKDQTGAILDNAEEVNGTKVVTAMFNGAPADSIRMMCENLAADVEDVVAVLASVTDGKLIFACSCSKNAIAKGLKAGNVVRAVAQIAGGNGGGKPNLAMAGGKDITKADEALYSVKGIVEAALN
ncbi:alanine--tRNA ligase [uncultured Ruminococcus sp.]|uniref:alanine--tRNA ligase n=1 Tax=uncultured Ruminococcus sp. TaxID=165186 RepID=UPI00292F7B15|nr:alanine--tRNA ligase [uncultured Ruminococcus sp.]